MKTLVYIMPISDYRYIADGKVRTEVEYYSDGSFMIADIFYSYTKVQ